MREPLEEGGEKQEEERRGGKTEKDRTQSSARKPQQHTPARNGGMSRKSAPSSSLAVYIPSKTQEFLVGIAEGERGILKRKTMCP